MPKNVLLRLLGSSAVFFSLFLIASSASAATYYVAQNGGNDSNPCTANDASKAKQTIRAGLACVGTAQGVGANQVVEVSAGTYAESLYQGANNYQYFMPSGTSWSAPFTLRAKQGDLVTVRANAGISDFGIWSDADAPFYTIIQGFTFDGTNTGGQVTAMGSCCNGGNFVRLQNNEFINSGTSNTFFVGQYSHNVEFINNKIHGGFIAGSGCGQISCYAYPIYWQGSDGLIEGNEIYDFPSWGIHMYLYAAYQGGSFPNNNIIRNNKIHDFGFGDPARSNGILVSTGNNNQVYNNIVYNGSSGIGGGLGGSDTEIYSNTVYNMSVTGIGVDNSISRPVIKNNISYQNGTNIDSQGPGTIMSNNLCGTAASGCTLVGNPNFVNAAAGDFHLQSNSPAINQGADLSSVFTTDFDGNTRVLPYDLGAYEYGGTVSPTPTPTPTPTSSGCTNLWNSTLAVPTNFGASFNWFTSAKELLINVLCSNSSETVNIGNNSQTEYIYNQGYYWGGTSWTPYTYSCSNLLANAWCVGNAQTSLSLDPATKQSVLAYICDWNGTNWNCGCHDSSCATNYWNLQQFKQ
jgi:hypothetical protein